MRADEQPPCDEAQAELVTVLNTALGNFVQQAVQARTQVAAATSFIIGFPVSAAALALLDALSTRSMRPSELAAFVGIKPSSLTKQLQELEAKALVDRTTDELDGRAAIIELTQFGREALAAAEDIRRSILCEVIADWSAEQVREVVDMLEQLTEGVLAGWKGFTSSRPPHLRARVDRQVAAGGASSD